MSEGFFARDGTRSVGPPGFGVLARRDNGSSATGGDSVIALAGVDGDVGSNAGDLLLGRDLIKQLGPHRRIGASPMSLVVKSAARVSSDFSSIPMWIFRQILRLAPPCLRAFHSPLPSTLMPVLSTKRCSIKPFLRLVRHSKRRHGSYHHLVAEFFQFGPDQVGRAAELGHVCKQGNAR